MHPDLQPGSGCEFGCGIGTTFERTCEVASHELIETVTDAEVGGVTRVGPPLAWYDTRYGEVGDICVRTRGTILGGDGISYAVQLEWSNVLDTCITERISCGNAVIDPPEECDEGTANGSSSCTTACQFPSRARQALATLPGTSDLDPRTSPVGPSHRRTGFARIDTARDRITLALVVGLTTDLHPTTRGAHLRVESQAGTIPLEVTLPPGSYGGPGTRGWVRSARRTAWTYRDATGMPLGGIGLVRMKELSGHRLSIEARGHGGRYAVVPGDEPLRTAVGPGGADADAVTAFAAGACAFDRHGRRLTCRE